MRNKIESPVEIDTTRLIDSLLSDRAPADGSMHDAIGTSEPREARHV